MKQKNKNLYVKKMQKSSMLFMILLCFFLCACTKRTEAHLSLLPLTEEESTESTAAPSKESVETLPKVMQSGADSEEKQAEADSEVQPAEKQLVYVHVCGAVKEPGVYELPEGSRVFEAVEAAGGFEETAEADFVNQAQPVPDGGMVVIPTLEQAEALRKEQGKAAYGILSSQMTEGVAESATEGNALQKESLVNLNTAQKAELCTLPGIGDAKAEAILAYREKKGRFASKEELKNIEGIKDGVYKKIEDKICIE